ncbi:DNA adenine methylase [Listeria booriae]|uniref:DNA adenine methylase n=1 Tax=Listeria booriae TaxID=1552123 RepID=UPI00164D4674|nr:Dam family site-specific DNA-(adenine-N6)-methyltransferase [Listeria booriae]MBC6298692.1 Dam family site-specific DNA-(adenine-N6)-methyltransferase [Listeria booriae]
MDKVISSPIRWTGSKKKLLNEMLYTFKEDKEIYIEPFLGSGTVLINVLNNNMYKKYYVNDINSSLINFYITLKEDSNRLANMITIICLEYNALENENEKESYYYEMRVKYNEEDLELYHKSAVFWFLMKSGYNGVYRINLKGSFNVPFGKKETITFDKKNAEYISTLIQPVEFYCMGYKEFSDEISQQIDLKNAFMYCDPPYIPETKSMQNQVLYTKDRFNHSDFISHILNTADIFQGFRFMISMSDSLKTNELYDIWELEKIHICDIIRNVNPTKRFVSKEIAFLNYTVSEVQVKKAYLELM